MALASKPEKPSKGSKLTYWQHVFPARSIERFQNSIGVVQFHDFERNKIRPAGARDPMFCARRAWDQRAERGYMKQIEDSFQGLAERIVNAGERNIDEKEKHTVDLFYSLWSQRANKRHLPEQEIASSLTGYRLSKEQEEKLEANFTSFIREDGRMPARMLNGIAIQVSLAADMSAYSPQLTWGVLISLDGEFIVPDVPAATYIPLTPTTALAANTEGGVVTNDVVRKMNEIVSGRCEKYLFARDLSKCPGINIAVLTHS